jgi:hypothetical protein
MSASCEPVLDMAAKVQQLHDELKAEREKNACLTSDSAQLASLQTGIRAKREDFWNSKLADFFKQLRENADEGVLTEDTVDTIHGAWGNPKSQFVPFQDFIRVAHSVHENSRSALAAEQAKNKAIEARLAEFEPKVAAVTDTAVGTKRARTSGDDALLTAISGRACAGEAIVPVSTANEVAGESMLNDIFANLDAPAHKRK